MTTFLLIISLLLNGITIFSIIILYARQNRLLEVEKAQEHIVKEMEEVISSYLLEMKEENEDFIKQFQQINTSLPSDKIQMGNQQKGNLNKLKAAAKDVNSGAEENEEKNKWNSKVGNALKRQAVQAYHSMTTIKEENSPVLSPNKIEDSPLPAGTNQAENNTNEQMQQTNEEIYRDLFVNQVRLLQKQGLSIDEIAKKMNRGKTEIELLLKFS